jgi:hypothetical protein
MMLTKHRHVIPTSHLRHVHKRALLEVVECVLLLVAMTVVRCHHHPRHNRFPVVKFILNLVLSADCFRVVRSLISNICNPVFGKMVPLLFSAEVITVGCEEGLGPDPPNELEVCRPLVPDRPANSRSKPIVYLAFR